jgi:hypothetical protein
MGEHIITPKGSRWETVVAQVRGWSPQVKQALIGAAVALVIAIASCVSTVVVYVENGRLKAKVHEQEQELIPFHNLAVQEFRSADAASMKRLAELMSTLRSDYTSQLAKVDDLRVELEQVRKSVPRRRGLLTSAAQEMVAGLRLTTVKTVQVYTQSEDIDTKELAQVVAEVCMQAPATVSLSPIIGVFQMGVRVVTRGPVDDPLRKAMLPLFASIGEKPDFRENSKLGTDVIQIYVGAPFSR